MNEQDVLLKKELDAAVEYHANYRKKIDIALGEPRGSDDILANHLEAIAKLQSTIADLDAENNELRREVEHRGQVAWNRLSESQKDAAIRLG
jgi:phage shock protein A